MITDSISPCEIRLLLSEFCEFGIKFDRYVQTKTSRMVELDE